ncbi:hypothetical protein ASV06_11305 [Enterobacter hormaechei subsp. xiangfangensis]|nr:hypothetical protein ASV06_11305 [Enterobacter hormaechei subsp. xiangfangensis]
MMAIGTLAMQLVIWVQCRLVLIKQTKPFNSSKLSKQLSMPQTDRLQLIVTHDKWRNELYNLLN